MKELFIIGLCILAIGVGALVFGLTVTREVLQLYGLPIMKQGDPVLIGIGAGFSVFGLGVIIGSIMELTTSQLRAILNLCTNQPERQARMSF